MTRKRSHTSGRRFLPGEQATRDTLLRTGVAAAKAHRRRLDGTTFVGITGSAGKSTATALVARVLGVEPRRRGGANRLSRVARQVLRTRRGTLFVVAEVAAWRPGSVAEIAAVLRPDIAVVTRIGLDHYRQFRSLEAVAAEKRALVEALPADGVAVLNADDPHVLAMAAACTGRVLTIGTAEGATLRASDVRSAWPDPLTFTLDGTPVRTRLNGAHWVTTALAALAVADAVGIPRETALERVAAFEPITGRMSILESGGVTFVRDDMKAPAWSLDTVLAFLADARAERKVLVVGTISDYAGSSSGKYRSFARQALEVADRVVFVGPNASHVKRVDGVRCFATVHEATAHLANELRDGDLVVLKCSNRADHLIRIALARTQTVRCHRDHCRRLRFCEDCRLLKVPGG